MANDDDFVTEVVDRMQVVGPAVARKMFGGHGIFLDDRMFALIVDNQLYLKTDAQNQVEFEALELPRFSYTQASGKVFSMAYHLAPDEFFDEPEQSTSWASSAWQAALRAPQKKKRQPS